MKRTPVAVHLFLLPALAAAIACSKPTADDHVKKAEQYLAQSRPQEALVEYRLAEQADPRRGDVRLKLGDLYMSNRDGGNALKEYVRAADLLPADADAQLKAGRLLLLANQFEDAKARADKALQLDPKNADAQILLGNALAGVKDLDGAIAQYQEAIALNPSSEAPYANIGTIQLAQGKPAEAEAMFRKAVEAAPRSVNARLALANFLWATRRFAESERALKDALALDPDNGAANRALGVFYMASNRAAEAEPYFLALAARKDPAALLALADYYAGLRRFAEARGVLADLKEQPASDAVASLRLASIAAAEGQRANAVTIVREVLQKYPKDATARLFNARLLLLDNKRDEALAAATALVSDQPDAAVASEAHLLIGSIYSSIDRRDDAIKSYEEALKLQPRGLQPNIALALEHLRSGALDKAATYGRQALALQPAEPGVHVLMARIALAGKDKAKSAAEIDALARNFPKSPVVWNLVALQRLQNGKADEARAAYTKASELAPHDLESTMGLVQLDLAAGRKQQAVERMEAALHALSPSAPSSAWLMFAGRTYAAAGDMGKAEQVLQRAVETDPGRLQPYSLLAELYIRQNRLDDAKRRFEQMLERDPRSVGINTMLGMLLDLQHKNAEAESQYRKVLALDARAAVASNNLAWIYVTGNRNLDEALQLARTAYEQMPEEPNVNDTLGWIYYQKNLPTQAVHHLELSVQKNPTSVDSLYHLGLAYVQAGELDKARKTLTRALALKPDADDAANAKKALAMIG